MGLPLKVVFQNKKEMDGGGLPTETLYTKLQFSILMVWSAEIDVSTGPDTHTYVGSENWK